MSDTSTKCTSTQKSKKELIIKQKQLGSSLLHNDAEATWFMLRYAPTTIYFMLHCETNSYAAKLVCLPLNKIISPLYLIHQNRVGKKSYINVYQPRRKRSETNQGSKDKNQTILFHNDENERRQIINKNLTECLE